MTGELEQSEAVMSRFDQVLVGLADLSKERNRNRNEWNVV